MELPHQTQHSRTLTENILHCLFKRATGKEYSMDWPICTFLKCIVFSSHWSNTYSARNLSLPQTLRYIIVYRTLDILDSFRSLGFRDFKVKPWVFPVSIRQKMVFTEVKSFLITLSFWNSFSTYSKYEQNWDFTTFWSGKNNLSAVYSYLLSELR